MIISKNPKDQLLLDALPGLVARAQKLLELFGSKHKVNYDESDTLCDPSIEIDGTGIGISIMWGERKTILGTKPEIVFGAYSSTFIHAVMYYRDGSGQPAEVDVHELGEASFRMDDALVHMLKALVEYEVRGLQDYEADLAEADWLEGFADKYSNDIKG